MSDKRVIRLAGVALIIVGIVGLNLARQGFFEGSDGGIFAVLAAPLGLLILILARPKKKERP